MPFLHEGSLEITLTIIFLNIRKYKKELNKGGRVKEKDERVVGGGLGGGIQESENVRIWMKDKDKIRV